MATEDRPLATITVRLIRSFEHRNIRLVIFRDIDLDIKAGEFQKTVLENVKNRLDLPPPVRNYNYDTMKIQHQAYGSKTNDPVINTGDDEKLTLNPLETLRLGGVRNETEISFFNMHDYKLYKDHKLNS